MRPASSVSKLLTHTRARSTEPASGGPSMTARRTSRSMPSSTIRTGAERRAPKVVWRATTLTGQPDSVSRAATNAPIAPGPTTRVRGAAGAGA